MATAHIIYQGQLRSQATHLQSGTVIITDAPTDNHGKGEAFSPTDLVATALGSCMITTMGIQSQNTGVHLDGTEIVVHKLMSSDAPRRISGIKIELTMKGQSEWPDELKERLIRIAHTCPVAISLHPDLVQEITFAWA